MKYKNYNRTFLADLTTPVALYLKIRERYGVSALLESSDYSSKEDSLSFIAFDSISSFEYKNHKLSINGVKQNGNVLNSLQDYINSFESENDSLNDGLYGFTGFDAIHLFENLAQDQSKKKNDIATLRYDFFRYQFVFDHFYNKISLIEHCPEGEASKIDELVSLIRNQDHQTFGFDLEGQEDSSSTDQEYKALVTKAKAHCQRGDVFQMVLSRQFSQSFQGDEFNVYRALRSINPSPYLFYFDFGSYKIFGSSPETQLKITDGTAEIHPIAGTVKRTGEFQKDQMLTEQLLNDPKENAEHVMLVDLARNDLSRHTQHVQVQDYKTVQYFSHVIHLVSKVTGHLENLKKGLQVFSDTFPAGTLSGAPKYRALQLIHDYENKQRDFYGGAIGYLGFNGDINHAIIIRSFLSIDTQLYYQAGAGIVIDSQEENELQEVNNKLAALKKALKLAETI